MINCANHRVKEADFHCASCQAAFCKDCVNIKDFLRSKIQVCPLCGNPVTSLAAYREVPPLWSRIPEVLAYPIRDNAYFFILGWAAFSLVFQGGAGIAMATEMLFGLVGAILCWIIYYGMMLNYLYRVITKTSEGIMNVPDFTEFRGVWGSLVWPMIQYYLLFLIMFWPISVTMIGSSLVGVNPFSVAHIVIYVLGFIYGLFMLPMGLLLLGVGRSVIPLLNPLFIISQVKKILVPYMFTVAFIFIFLIVYSVFRTFISIMFQTEGLSMTIGAVKNIIDGAVQIYMVMVIGHALGYLAYEQRFELKWWPQHQNKPVFMIGGVPASMGKKSPAGAPAPAPVRGGAPGRAAAAQGAVAAAGAAASVADDLEMARQISDGMAMLDHGRHQEALNVFTKLSADYPNHLGVQRGLTMTYLKMKDTAKASEAARKQAALLFRDKAFDAAWELFTEMQKLDKNFVLGPREMVMLAKWLQEQSMFMESAKVLRAMAVVFPDDPMAPKALYQCADLLANKCGKPDTAAQLYDYLLKRYPNVPFAEQVKAARAQLKI